MNLNLLKPNIDEEINGNLLNQKVYNDMRAKEKTFKEGTFKWKEGLIVKKNVELSFRVRVDKHLIRKNC